MEAEGRRAVSEYRELRVYRNAFEAASLVFQLTRQFPVEERFSLTDQIRRSSRSVGANIVEAWRKRRYPSAFVSKLSDADGEAAETQYWLTIAHDCGYVDAETSQMLADRYDHICAQLARMMANADHWCAPVTGKRTQ
jgi:four helix bundle protein